MQIWEKTAIGIDRKALLGILKEFRQNGIQGISSNMQLTIYLKRLSTEKVFEMIDIDREATLQMLVDCLGVEKAFEIAQGKSAQEEKALFHMTETIKDMKSELARKDQEIMTLKAKLYDAYEEHNTRPTENSNKGELRECRKEQTRSVLLE
jgi:hypothetical protein